MDSKLSFNKHIEYVVNKSKAVLNFVRRQSSKLDRDAIMLLYSSLVRTNLEFVCSIWSPNHAIYIKSLESVQKQLLMFLNGDREKQMETNDYALTPYIDRCNHFKLETLLRRRFNATAILMHGLVSGRRDSPFIRSKFTINDDERLLRNPGILKWNKNYRTRHSQHSPFDQACSIFNFVSNLID